MLHLLYTVYFLQVMYLSKVTAATLDDMDYIVDPSAVRFRLVRSRQ